MKKTNQLAEDQTFVDIFSNRAVPGCFVIKASAKGHVEVMMYCRAWATAGTRRSFQYSWLDRDGGAHSESCTMYSQDRTAVILDEQARQMLSELKFDLFMLLRRTL